MKVRELIEELQKLNQERNIWLVYDLYLVYEPFPRTANEFEVGINNNDFVVEEGDYVI